MASKFVWALATAFLVVVGILAFTGIASADIGATAVSYSEVELTTEEVATANSASSVTALRFVNPNGLPQSQRRNCRMIGVGTNVPTYWNSGVGQDGRLYWFRDTKRAKICGNRKVACGNFVRFTRPPTNVITGPVRMVRRFNFTVKLKVTAALSASVSAYATCTTGGVTATATATASGWARAEAFVSAKARSKTVAWVQAQAAAQQWAVNQEESLKASARASAELNLQAVATAVCTGAPPPIKLPPPGVPPPPPPLPPPPKDGTQGPGEGTPGQPGGPGADGDPAPPSQDPSWCRDPVSGDLVAGAADQFGYCV